jgi:hypothetical protein
MSVAEEYEIEIARYLSGRMDNEWALFKMRESLESRLQPDQAYEEIPGVFELAGRQDDEYAFASCCRLVMTLARIADTTEPFAGFSGLLPAVETKARQLGEGSIHELESVLRWYRAL